MLHGVYGEEDGGPTMLLRYLTVILQATWSGNLGTGYFLSWPYGLSVVYRFDIKIKTYMGLVNSTEFKLS